MGKLQRIGFYSRAMTSQALALFINAGLSMVLVAWLARELGPSGFSLYAYLLTIGLLILPWIEGGWNNVLYKTWAGQAPESIKGTKADVLHRVALIHSAVATFLTSLLLWLLLRDFLLSLAISACFFAVALDNQVSMFLRGTQRFTHDALWQLSIRVLSLLAIMSILKLHGGQYALPERLAALFFAWAGSNIALLVAFLLVRKLRNLSVVQSGFPAQIKAIYRQIFYFLFYDFLLVAMMRMDLILIDAAGRNALPGFDQTANLVWAVTGRFIDIAILALAPMTNLVIGLLGKSHAWSPAQRSSTLSYLGLALGIGTVLYLLINLWPGLWMGWLLGSGYEPMLGWLPWSTSILPAFCVIWMLLPYALSSLAVRDIVGYLLSSFLINLLVFIAFAYIGFGPFAVVASSWIASIYLGSRLLAELRRSAQQLAPSRNDGAPTRPPY